MSAIFDELARLDPASMSAITAIAAERLRQIQDERCTIEHDDSHDMGELATAGALYALNAGPTGFGRVICPWPDYDWKLGPPPKDLRRAGALVVAEMARRNRAALDRLADGHDIGETP